MNMNKVTLDLPRLPPHVDLGGGALQTLDSLSLQQWRDYRAELERCRAAALLAVEEWEALGLLMFGTESRKKDPWR